MNIKQRVAAFSPKYDRVLAKLRTQREKAEKKYVETGDRKRLDQVDRRHVQAERAFYQKVRAPKEAAEWKKADAKADKEAEKARSQPRRTEGHLDMTLNKGEREVGWRKSEKEEAKDIQTGARGGRYYTTSDGKKVYVK